MSTEGYEGVLKFKQRSAGQLQFVLVGLVERSLGIVEKRRSGLLDVVAEDLGDGLAVGESDEAVDARNVFRKTVDVQTAGIKRVAGKQYRGFSVVEGDARGGVSRDGNGVNQAVAQVDAADV